MLYPSCSEANMGLFQALLTDEDAVISDQLNHGSCIDGIRLSKSQRHRQGPCSLLAKGSLCVGQPHT